MKEDKEWKMTFWMKYKHYKYIIMSFELKNVSTIFQWLINNTLQKYFNDFVIIYLNDILIYSEDLETHCKYVQKILKKLKKRALYVRQLKNKFEIQKIKFLNYVIWSKWIKKNSKKTAAIRNWSTLIRFKEIQIFLELANYYWKFVSNYSRIAESFMQLM